MTIDDKQYKHWLKLSIILCNSRDQAEEVLQDVLVKLLQKDLPDDKWNDNYIFISLRNKFLDKQKQLKKDYSTIDEDYDIEDLNIEYDKQEEVSKMQSINDIVLSLRLYEQQLYMLHFIHGLSQREISRKTGIHHRTINNRIIKITSKIKEYHKNKTKTNG